MHGLLGMAFVFMMVALPVTAAALAERLAPCLACHGAQGQSEQPEVPSLGAQPAFYVMVQLYMFRERLRIVEVMNATTQGLTDDDLRSMAEVIAKLPPPRPAASARPGRTRDRDTRATGRRRSPWLHRRRKKDHGRPTMGRSRQRTETLQSSVVGRRSSVVRSTPAPGRRPRSFDPPSQPLNRPLRWPGSLAPRNPPCRHDRTMTVGVSCAPPAPPHAPGGHA